MATSTYTPIASITLGSSASSVTFSSIPQDYRDLVLVINGGVTSSIANLDISFNNDTTSANFSLVHMSGDGSSTSSGASSDRRINNLGYLEADLHTIIVLNVMDYSATDKHTTYLSRANNADNGTTALAGRWANTSAITEIDLNPDASTFRTGTTLALYGIVS